MESRALSWFAFDPDFTAVQFRDPPNFAQAEAETTARFSAGEEGIE